MLALASLLVVPTFFASAAELDGSHEEPRHQPPTNMDKRLPPRFHIGEVVEVDPNANTILVKSLRPSKDGEVKYVFVTYDDQTTFSEGREDADESSVSVGDKIHVNGIVNWDSEQYVAEIDADHVILFEEKPLRPAHPGAPSARPEPDAS